MTMRSERPYGGVTADDRRRRRRTALLAAGLECLGGEDAEISVRRVCATSGLTQRYFYESFASLDELQTAVFTQIADEVAASTAAALSEHRPASLDEACRTSFAAAFAVFREDPRKARAAVAAAVGAAGLAEARRRVVIAYGESMLTYFGRTFAGEVDTAVARVTVMYAVGGALEIAHAAFTGEIELSDDELVDQGGRLLASSVRELVSRNDDVRSGASPA